MKTARQLWFLTQAQLGVLLHQRIGWLLLLALLALVGGSAALRGFNFGGGEARLVQSVAVASILGMGTLLVALAGPALFFHALATRSLELYASRGVARPTLLVAQAGALLVALGWLVVLGTLATVAVLLSLGHGAWCGPAMREIAGGAVPLVALIGVSIFASTIGRSAIFATALTLAVAMAGHLAPIIAHSAASTTGVMRAGWKVLEWIVPNFAAMQTAGGWGAGAALGCAVVFIAGGSFVFARREL